MRHLIRVMRTHDLTKKRDNDKDNDSLCDLTIKSDTGQNAILEIIQSHIFCEISIQQVIHFISTKFHSF